MSPVTRRNFTSSFHHDTYPALQVLLKHASVLNKSVFISGSGTGIGAATALAFARAGAGAIFLSGRTLTTLEQTQRRISNDFPNVVVGKFVFDINDGPQKAQEVFSHASNLAPGRTLDILVNNAGFIASLSTTEQSDDSQGRWEWDFERYWRHFEVNVKGALSLAAAFRQYCPVDAGTVINVTSGAAVIDFVPGLSAYAASKLAALKMFSYLNFEEQGTGLKVFHVHPGIVATAMAKEGKSNCEDTAELAADFIVWLNAPGASFLQNRFLYANWDVEELLSKKDEIVRENLLTMGVRGWDSTAM